MSSLDAYWLVRRRGASPRSRTRDSSPTNPGSGWRPSRHASLHLEMGCTCACAALLHAVWRGTPTARPRLDTETRRAREAAIDGGWGASRTASTVPIADGDGRCCPNPPAIHRVSSLPASSARNQAHLLIACFWMWTGLGLGSPHALTGGGSRRLSRRVWVLIGCTVIFGAGRW